MWTQDGFVRKLATADCAFSTRAAADDDDDDLVAQPHNAGTSHLATTAWTLSAAGGYANWCMLEEFDLIGRLRRLAITGGGRIVTLPSAALCSPRRWEKHSVWRTNAVNQAVMLWHRFGATPEQVFRFYYGVEAPKPAAAPP